MAFMTIADITLSSKPRPLEVRVLNMWETFCKIPTMACLLVDKHHDTIQAVFNKTDCSEVEKKLNIGKAYLLSGYTITLPPKFDRASPHPCAIRVNGDVVTYSLGAKMDIPLRCFNLVPRYHLHSKPYTDRQLIDYMGKVISLEEADIKENTTVLRMGLEAPGCLPIVVSLWDLIYQGLDMRRFTEADTEVIVVATALRVVTRGDNVRLQCTGGTQVFIDPGVTARRDMARHFRLSRNGQPLRKIALGRVSEIYPVPGLPVTYISHLYKQTEEALQNQSYLVACMMIEIPMVQQWYQVTCVRCDAIINHEEQSHTCLEHGDRYLLYRYSVRCMMDDGFGKISVTLSDASLIAMLGVRCFNLIAIGGFDDASTLPAPISDLIGTNWLLIISQGHRVADSLLEFRGSGVSPVPLTVIPPDEPAAHDIGTSEDRWEPGVDVSEQSQDVPSSQGSFSPTVGQEGVGNVPG